MDLQIVVVVSSRWTCCESQGGKKLTVSAPRIVARPLQTSTQNKVTIPKSSQVPLPGIANDGANSCDGLIVSRRLLLLSSSRDLTRTDQIHGTTTAQQ